MGKTLLDQMFFWKQYTEIDRYLKSFPHEDQEVVVMRWIDQNAAEFRASWNANLYRG